MDSSRGRRFFHTQIDSARERTSSENDRRKIIYSDELFKKNIEMDFEKNSQE